MAKEVTKENLCMYAKESLNGAKNMVLAGVMDPKVATGHVRELFYLSGTFGLGLQEEARTIIRELKSDK